MFFAILSVFFFPWLFFRSDRIGYFDEIAEISGIVLILLGQIFRLSARGYKAEHSGNGSSLIRGGPYSLIRNPMYLGILLIGIGIVLVLFNWWATVIFLLVFITRYLLLVFKEEKKLSAIFLGEYNEYQKRVPRIFPPMAMLIKRDISEYLPIKWLWIKREMGTILAVLLITLFLESWEDIKTNGFRIYLSEAIPIFITVVLFIGLVVYIIKRTDVATKSKNNP